MIPTLFKQLLAPGSLSLLGIGLLACWFLRRRWPRSVRACLFVLAVAYGLMSMPAIARQFGDRLMPPSGPATVDAPIDTLLILDGDNRRGRVRESLSVWNSLRPPAVVVLGGDWIVNELTKAGVPGQRIQMDGSPRNTREQLAWVRRYVTAHEGSRIAIVASRLQAPRVAGLMAAAQVRAQLLPSPIDVEPAREGAWRFVPSYAALRVSRDAIYELAAFEYYRNNSWIPR